MGEASPAALIRTITPCKESMSVGGFLPLGEHGGCKRGHPHGSRRGRTASSAGHSYGSCRGGRLISSCCWQRWET